ncbi:MAG: DUF3515 domain-containing protein [Nocardioides sp.]
MRHPIVGRGLLGCGAVLVLLAAGVLVRAGLDDGPVSVPRPRLGDAEQAACRDFIGDLPDRLADQDARPISPTHGLAAAWGDPAIVVRCRGDMPDEFDEFAACEEIAGIGWFTPPDQLTDQTVDAQVSTIGVAPAITVLLPASRRANAAGVLVALAPALKAHLSAIAPCV